MKVFRSIARFVAGSRPARVAARLLPREPAIAVLNYHRILPARRENSFSLVVTADRFREQIQFLSAIHPILPLREALRRLSEDRLPARIVLCVTLDDGYRDNLLIARPILESVGITATLFCTTAYPDTGRAYWWERLERARRPLPPFPGSRSAEPPSAAPAAGEEALYRRLKAAGPDERDRWIDSLGAPTPSLEPWDLPMSWDELRSLPPAIEVGGHGHRHFSLGLASAGDADRDVAACARALRRELPEHVPLFAYPFGGPEDVGGPARDAVRAQGFIAAFTATPGVVRRDSDPLALPRLHVDDEPPRRLAARVLRVFATLG